MFTGFGNIPGKPAAEPSIVVVPVTGVSRLAERTISGALSISRHVSCVTVLTGEGPDGDDPDGDNRASELQEQWERWNPGPPLRVLHTEYASVAGPIIALVDQLNIITARAQMPLHLADSEPQTQPSR